MKSWTQANVNTNEALLRRDSDPLADIPRINEPDNTLSLRALWQRLHAARIQMVMINNNTYLGLVPGRLTTSLLKVGDTLFIFAPSNNPILSVTEFLSQILRNVPDQSLSGLHNLTEKQLMEAIGTAHEPMFVAGGFPTVDP